MKTRIYEGIRKQVSDLNSITISFKEIHYSVPVINVAIEPASSADLVAASVTNVSSTNATISFTGVFNGYLHLHAFSS